MSTSSRVAAAAAVLGPLGALDRPLGALTTYRVGGPAALFAEVGDEADLAKTVRAVSETGIDVLVLGKGSNLVVGDAGFQGLAVQLAGDFARLDIDAVRAGVVAGGAASYPVLARRTVASGLTGLEWAVGVPGSVGGAVRMNAGGHGADTARSLVSARIVDLGTGLDRDVEPGSLDLGYRRSSVGSHQLVVSARFALAPGDPADGEREISAVVKWRRANQPGGQNAGSVFANPPGDSAGRLVDLAGLKGMRIGKAEVSAKHGNFIQADASGSGDDVVRLVAEVRRLVQERLGVILEPEVRIVGAQL